MENKNNIVLIGFMASGKTTVGKMLSKKLNMNFFDTDTYIEKKEKLLINDIFKKYGESYFRDKEKETIRALLLTSNTVISTGGGIILNKENIDTLKTIGKIIFLDSSFKEIKKRLKNDKERPLNKGLSELKRLYQLRYNLYLSASDFIIKSDENPYNVCNEIIDTIVSCEPKQSSARLPRKNTGQNPKPPS